MSTDTTWVQAIVDPSLYAFLPGATIRLWGFDFVIYKDKSLCLEMHNDFIRTQVKAGRVKIMDGPPAGIIEEIDEDEIEIPRQKKIEVSLPEPEFTMDLESFFGHGDINTFMKELERLSVPKIKKVVKERFQRSFPAAITRKDLLDQVRTITDLEIIRSKNEEDDDE